MMKTEELKLTKKWDKTFPKSKKTDHCKVTFINRYGLTLAADMYVPKDAEGKLYIRRDCIHLNKRGEFLQACVWFAKLYGRPVSEVTFKPDMIADDDIEFLKGIAQEAVDKGI